MGMGTAGQRRISAWQLVGIIMVCSATNAPLHKGDSVLGVVFCRADSTSYFFPPIFSYIAATLIAVVGDNL